MNSTYEEMTSPRNAFSLAIRGGLNEVWAFSKYCMAGMLLVGVV